jgi:hypothetical protein
MTGTDPAKFDPEVTGAFQVQHLGSLQGAESVRITQVEADDFSVPAAPLAEAMQPGYAGDDNGAPPLPEQYALPAYTYPPVRQAPVSLMYAHSDGQTFTRVDVWNTLTHPSGDGDDDTHRERLLLRAILEHTLAMLKGEDVS